METIPAGPVLRHPGKLTANDILDGHVGLDLECFDRIYLNGWVPNRQVPGRVVGFLNRHLGFPIPSPAILERIGLRFRDFVCGAEGEAANRSERPAEERAGQYRTPDCPARGSRLSAVRWAAMSSALGTPRSV